VYPTPNATASCQKMIRTAKRTAPMIGPGKAIRNRRGRLICTSHFFRVGLRRPDATPYTNTRNPRVSPAMNAATCSGGTTPAVSARLGIPGSNSNQASSQLFWGFSALTGGEGRRLFLTRVSIERSYSRSVPVVSRVPSELVGSSHSRGRSLRFLGRSGCRARILSSARPSR